MPVHSHHCAERLKPEWIAQPRKELGPSISNDDRLGDSRSHLRHPVRQPMRDTRAVESEIAVQFVSQQAPQTAYLLYMLDDQSGFIAQLPQTVRRIAKIIVRLFV